jgi:hypothetical protein
MSKKSPKMLKHLPFDDLTFSLQVCLQLLSSGLPVAGTHLLPRLPDQYYKTSKCYGQN